MTQISVNNEETKNKEQEIEDGYPLRNLLYFFELVNQALEVKLESMFLIPSFLNTAVNEVKSRNALAQLTQMGENVIEHVRILRRVISDLGGTVEHDLLPATRTEAQTLLADLSFQEELAGQMIEQCQDIVERNWQHSALTSRVLQQLLTVQRETKLHGMLFEQIFARTQPRYRDIVMERFRITAIP